MLPGLRIVSRSATDLDLIYQAHGLASPEALLDDALARRAWSMAMGLAQQWPSRLNPDRMVAALAHHLDFEPDLRPADETLFAPPAASANGHPPMFDPWLLALVKAGADPEKDLEGCAEGAHPWTGSLHTLAVLGSAMATIEHLATLSPVASWVERPVTWQGRPTTLLHLACLNERWAVAKFLVDHGFPTHVPDADGARPWEKVGGHARPDSNEQVLDHLNLWPRTNEELAEGWKRLGPSVRKRGTDFGLLWRTRMISRLGFGGDFALGVAIERLLHLGSNSMSVFPREVEDLASLWQSLTPAERERPVALHNVPLRGEWSLAGAMAWAAAWLSTKVVPRIPQGKEPLSLNAFAALEDLDLFHQVLPSLSASELDRPIAQRKLVTGEGIALTARGLWAVGSMRVEQSLSQDSEAYRYDVPRPEPAAVRALLDSAAMSELARGAAKEKGDGPSWSQLRALCFPSPTDCQGVWTELLRNSVDSKHLVALWNTVDLPTVQTHGAFYTLALAPPDTPFPPEVAAKLCSPWESLLKTVPSFNLALRTQWQQALSHVGMGRLEDTWTQWGWPLPEDRRDEVVRKLEDIRPGWGEAFRAQARATTHVSRPSASRHRLRT